jgi:enoyl reductase-like protein
MDKGIEIGIDSVIFFTKTSRILGNATMVSERSCTDRPLVAAAVYVAGFVEQLAGGGLVDAGLWSKTNDQLMS